MVIVIMMISVSLMIKKYLYIMCVCFSVNLLLNIRSRVCGFVHFVQGSVQREDTCVFCNSYILVHIFQFILHTHTQDVIMDLKYIPSIRVYTTFSYIYI